MKNTQFIPTIVINADGTEVVENVPCESLKSTKFTTVKENSEESNNISKQSPKKFIPKFPMSVLLMVLGAFQSSRNNQFK